MLHRSRRTQADTGLCLGGRLLLVGDMTQPSTVSSVVGRFYAVGALWEVLGPSAGIDDAPWRLPNSGRQRCDDELTNYATLY